MEYLWVKYLHVTCVVISVSLFVFRGVLVQLRRPWHQWWLLRRGRHVVDTVLLGAAAWMAWQIGQYPFVHGWLTAKVLGLLAYIVLGMRALSKDTPRQQQLPYLGASLLSVAYIVGVALTRSPSWGLL